ncbi:ethanolamine [Botrytis cinerea]
MATTSTPNTSSIGKIRFIPLSYNSAESQTSALRLILTLRPEWEQSDGKIEFIRFTDGITNTLLKVINQRPGLTKEEIDNEAVLLRAYGQGTDLIIDRERETQNHELLTQYNLAPALLARFKNGMLYRFIRGAVTSPADLRQQRIWRGVARRLAEWHAVVPCLATNHEVQPTEINGSEQFAFPAALGKVEPALQSAIDNAAPGKPAPNVWTVMQKWIYALPVGSEVEKTRQATLQKELTRLVAELSNRPGLGENSLVFAHCDLLSGNVIVQPQPTGTTTPAAVETVSFIDYEYATPSPAAFDIANHFAEWGGFDCEHQYMPTRAERLDFIREYIRNYFAQLKQTCDEEAEVQKMFTEVDATISQIDFDYAAYAEIRLGEYWAWRGENDGSRAASGKEMSLRERRWAQDA